MMDVTTQEFFSKATAAQFEFAFNLYDEALSLKSEQKKNPQELLKLDKWYQHDLPKIITGRGEYFITHEELVQCMKWKLARGKFKPRLKELVQMNTPRVVLLESKKAFRQLCKRNNITSAIQALCKLKGIGPATASAILAAGVPEKQAFMADEVFEAVHLDDPASPFTYSPKEYKVMNESIRKKVDKLNQETDSSRWTPHRVELAIWTHSVLSDLNPSGLQGMPPLTSLHEAHIEENGQLERNGTTAEKNESSREANDSGESGNQSGNEANGTTDDSATNSPLEDADEVTEPHTKKPRLQC